MRIISFRRAAAVVLLFAVLITSIPAASASITDDLLDMSAATARASLRSMLDGIVSDWNQTDYSRKSGSTMVKVWDGATAASGCAAFSRYAFYKLYGHADTLNNSNNTVHTYTVNSILSLFNTLTMNAAPGDAVRISRVVDGKESQTRTHIFNLLDIDSSGKIYTYESNYTTTNKARSHTYSSVTAMAVNSGPKLTVSAAGSFDYPMLVKIIHSKKNPLNSSFFSCDSGGSSGGSGSGSGGSVTVKYGTVHNTAGNLAINSIAASGYQIGKIPEGGVCMVYPDKSSGNWYWVEYNGVQGYSYGKYITLSDTKPGSSGSGGATGAVHGTVHDTAGNLAINAQPKSTSNGATMLGKIPEGEVCVVYPSRKSGGWYWVEYHGVTGYAYGKYITLGSAHVMDHRQEAAEPTCYNYGTKGYYWCSGCFECYLDAAGTQWVDSNTLDIKPTGHTLEHFNAVAPSCTEDGNLEYWHCTECGQYFDKPESYANLEDLILEALGHDYQDGVCTRCGEADPDWLPAVVDAGSSSDEIAVTIAGGKTPSRVLCALYDSDGRMLDASAEDVLQGETLTYRFPVENETSAMLDHWRVLFLSPQGIPLCEQYMPDIPVE